MWTKEQGQQIPTKEWKSHFLRMLEDRHQSQLAWEKAKTKITGWKQTSLVIKETTEATPNKFDFSTRLSKKEPIIRKVAPEPSGFTSFDKDLEEEIDMTNLKDRVLVEYHSYLNIFSKRWLQRLPKHTIWDHVIDLKLSFKPQAPIIFPLSPEKHDELGKFVKEHLSRGTIH